MRTPVVALEVGIRALKEPLKAERRFRPWRARRVGSCPPGLGVVLRHNEVLQPAGAAELRFAESRPRPHVGRGMARPLSSVSPCR
jgi:hypothetical protein